MLLSFWAVVLSLSACLPFVEAAGAGAIQLGGLAGITCRGLAVLVCQFVEVFNLRLDVTEVKESRVDIYLFLSLL